MQSTNYILMVTPFGFTFNEKTKKDNVFQNKPKNSNIVEIEKKALKEFYDMTNQLKKNDVEVIIVKNENQFNSPDKVFPNNWFSTHRDGTLIIYPIMAENRRIEREIDITSILNPKFEVHKVIDLTHYEKERKFLEGTGSVVFDREYKIMYACQSERTNLSVLKQLQKIFSYKLIFFPATDKNNLPIYHTNVILSITKYFIIVCMEAIPYICQQEITEMARSTDKEIIDISFLQLNSFCGNILEVQNKKKELFIMMSSRAFHCFSDIEKQRLQKYYKIIHTPIPTIENIGGGGVRCMMAEIFLPIK